MRGGNDAEQGNLRRLLRAFVDAHPGTRRGQLFGRPAAYAGTRPFAEITGAGLACRLSPQHVRERGWSTGVFRPDRRPGWVIVSNEALAPAQMAQVTTALELAVREATVSPEPSE